VSTASVFEVAALHTAGRLRLARPPEQWVRDSVDAGALRIVDLSPSIAIDAGSIPRSGLEDPMDRLIVATARQEDATLMTADTTVLAYAADTHNVRVQDARR
jgi:PIN domain nuclease of toxin-antitoxin system